MSFYPRVKNRMLDGKMSKLGMMSGWGKSLKFQRNSIRAKKSWGHVEWMWFFSISAFSRIAKSVEHGRISFSGTGHRIFFQSAKWHNLGRIGFEIELQSQSHDSFFPLGSNLRFFSDNILANWRSRDRNHISHLILQATIQDEKSTDDSQTEPTPDLVAIRSTQEKLVKMMENFESFIEEQRREKRKLEFKRNSAGRVGRQETVQ